MTDPTRVREQPSLTTSTGTIWIVVGGLFALVSLAIIVPMVALPPAGLAIGAAVVIVVLYAAMIVARVAVPAGRRRLGVLAAGMLLIAGVALVTVLVVAGSAWSGVAA